MKKVSDEVISKGFLIVALLLSGLLCVLGFLFGFGTPLLTVIAVALITNIVAFTIWLVYLFKFKDHQKSH